MLSLKKLYKENIYGIIGALTFHIFLVVGFLIAEMNLEKNYEKEEAILLDFTIPKENVKESILKPESTPSSDKRSLKSITSLESTVSNRAVNDAAKTDKFFDASYRRDIENAKKMVSDVNTQLSKKVQPINKITMPEVSSEGQNPDSVKNVIYSGKSNIHYSLKNRIHLRLPIPVYLAKGGGVVVVDIQVDRSGTVVKAQVRSSREINDPMLPLYATQAAERTVFNQEGTAPSIQNGTITYTFVAQ